jgi:S-DNA-T family DNA segregation ATPase FtsK/SpoIIIE
MADRSSRSRRRPSPSRTGQGGLRGLVQWRHGPDRTRGAGLALFMLGLWGGIALLVGLPGEQFLRRLCGWGAYPLALATIAGGALLAFGGPLRRWWRWWLLVGAEIAWLAALTLTQLGSPDGALLVDGAGWPDAPQAGGLIGWVISGLLARAFGTAGAWVISLFALVGGGWLIWRSLPEPVTMPVIAAGQDLGRTLRAALARRRGTPDVEQDAVEAAEPEPVKRRLARDEQPSAEDALAKPRRPTAAAVRTRRQRAQPQPTALPARPAALPPLDLLVPDKVAEVTDVIAQEKAALIERTLASFHVPVEVVEINIGPAVTQFGVRPLPFESGGQQRMVRVSRIQALANDLALALAAPAIRIEAPVPGRPYVGIEVPNRDATLVTLRGILESPQYQRLASPLAIGLGRDVSGHPAVADLARMPHLLIAGATGSGKSVCLNTIIVSLLMNNGPDRLRLLMVDPKMVELVGYNGIPHLVAPVVTDLKQVVAALVWMTLQMDERYRRFNASGVRNIEAYNKKVARRSGDDGPLPYMVLVIDELADLMMTAPEEVERYICRLAQMARATGIHLVIATQRPSVDVVTGLIKANFPARIAFAVASGIDSRVVLDQPGAEKLLGRGDMLFMRPESSKLQRIQGCFVSDREIQAVVDFWRKAAPEQPRVAGSLAPWVGLLDKMEEEDDLLEQALRELQGVRTTSASMLQRRLRIGYPRAAELLRQLEAMGAVGPEEGGGRPRRVLLRPNDDDDAEDLLFDD